MDNEILLSIGLGVLIYAVYILVKMYIDKKKEKVEERKI